MPASSMPLVVPPMLPSQGDLGDGDRRAWAVEFAWTGFRCVAYVEPGSVRLLSSTGRSVTSVFPELAVLGERVEGAGMVLDGVVVALDDAGRPSRRPLMKRTSTMSPSEALRDRVPVGFVVTDLLWLDGRSLLRRPYHERRARLEELAIAGPPVLVPPSHPASEAAFVMEAAERFGLDGLHLKRLDAAYKSGRRTKDWLRVPLRRTRPVVVGGWMPTDPSRGRIGALLLGIPERPGGRLRYVGRVGIGSAHARRQLTEALRTVHAKVSPFVADGPGAVPAPVAADARWLVPTLVGQADYQGWTRGAHLRLPVWGGILAPDQVGDTAWEGTPWRREYGEAAERAEIGGAAPPPTPPVAPSSVNRSLEQHFVYNAFTTIAALMRTRPTEARELLLGFADLSRIADRVGTPEIPLSDELAAVRAYLAIEQARFGRRLRTSVAVAEGLEDVVVAPLQILVAVRAAVQEGVEPRPSGGSVRVTVTPDATGGALVEVADEGHRAVRMALHATASTPV
jgi:hypothetical protein